MRRSFVFKEKLHSLFLLGLVTFGGFIYPSENMWTKSRNAMACGVVGVALFYASKPLASSLVKKIDDIVHPKDKVGVISIEGVIVSCEEYCKQVREFFEDSSIKAILFKINSPGGVDGPSQFLINEIKELKKINPKPVIVLVESLCGSAAYWIAVAADCIICSPSSIMGCIGTFIPHFDFTAALKNNNVSFDIISSCEHKIAGDPFRELTSSQRDHLQSVIDDAYDLFVTDVATARGISKDAKKIWADGKIFTGRQALALGLVDKVGSLATVLETLKEKKITNRIEWIYPKSQGLVESMLFGPAQSHSSSYMETLAKNIVSAFSKASQEALASKTQTVYS